MSGYWMVVLVLSLITSARVSGALRRPLRRAGVETRLNALSCLIGLAQQGARANAGICYAACDRMSFELKQRNASRDAARGAPAGPRGSSLTLGKLGANREVRCASRVSSISSGVPELIVASCATRRSSGTSRTRKWAFICWGIASSTSQKSCFECGGGEAWRDCSQSTLAKYGFGRCRMPTAPGV